ncbi:hypothetical protein [Gilliamella sp. wkB112]|uniref:hypothetical protein n=1 Tax=Gilliamella sp. wkB112 TaxID=3120257 RepID=UPI00080E137A|nr:hypothetical protein [Gilliamella apicola]OCG00865.1 hypothetical protein A9G12_03635 [Gilliamella apicola]
MNIQINRLGKILQGDEKGYYIKIIDDLDNTGSFLILTSPDIDMKKGFDNWVKDKRSLEGYFMESNWLIEWL